MDIGTEGFCLVLLPQVKDARNDHVHMPVNSACDRDHLRHCLVCRFIYQPALDDRFRFVVFQIKCRNFS